MYFILLLCACCAQIYFFMMQRTALEFSRAHKDICENYRNILPKWYSISIFAVAIKWILAIIVLIQSGWVWCVFPVAACYVISVISPIPYDYFVGLLTVDLANSTTNAGQEKKPLPVLDKPPLNLKSTEPEEMFRNGIAYFNGDGVSKDERAALNFFEDAANAGHPAAQFAIAQMFEEGIVVCKNVPLAIKWYSLSSMNGNSKATAKLKSITNFDVCIEHNGASATAIGIDIVASDTQRHSTDDQYCTTTFPICKSSTERYDGAIVLTMSVNDISMHSVVLREDLLQLSADDLSSIIKQQFCGLDVYYYAIVSNVQSLYKALMLRAPKALINGLESLHFSNIADAVHFVSGYLNCEYHAEFIPKTVPREVCLVDLSKEGKGMVRRDIFGKCPF